MNIIKDEPTIWRLQTRTASEDGNKISGYCRKNNILAMGWSLCDSTINEFGTTQEEINNLKLKRDNVKDEKDYANLFKIIYSNDYKKHGNKINPNITRLQQEVKINDLVWMRDNGVYYIGRVGENSKWQYFYDEETSYNDAGNQRTDIEWIEVGAEDSVPGKVCTAFIQGHTLQRINKSGVNIFSKYIYNKNTATNNKYNIENIKSDDIKKCFYSYISPTDCEDLLCMWLYKKCGYICIPSTNKNATESYECVLLNPVDGKRIFIQVKCGDTDINAEKYIDLDGDVYLFTSYGKLTLYKNKNNIKQVSSDELFEFAFDLENKNLLPKNILTWVTLIKELEKVD